MDPEAKTLLERLEKERDQLASHGYRFPALFDAVGFLLRRAQIAPDRSDDV